MDPWFVYIVRCADETLYVGIARDVNARLAQHEAGKGAKYTRGRGPLVLLRKRRCASKGDALRLEIALKRLARAEKLDVATSTARLGKLAAASRVAKTGASGRAPNAPNAKDKREEA